MTSSITCDQKRYSVVHNPVFACDLWWILNNRPRTGHFRIVEGALLNFLETKIFNRDRDKLLSAIAKVLRPSSRLLNRRTLHVTTLTTQTAAIDAATTCVHPCAAAAEAAAAAAAAAGPKRRINTRGNSSSAYDRYARLLAAFIQCPPVWLLLRVILCSFSPATTRLDSLRNSRIFGFRFVAFFDGLLRYGTRRRAADRAPGDGTKGSLRRVKYLWRLRVQYGGQTRSAAWRILL